MVGLAFTSVQPSGVTTTFATIIDIRWQPMLAANLIIGYFLDETSFLAGLAPVATQYFIVDITQINPTLAIPPQLISQLTAVGAPLYGGTIV